MELPVIPKRSRKLLLNPGVILPFLGLAFVACFLRYDDRAVAQGQTPQQVQDEQIRAMQRQIEINTGRISNLEIHGSQATLTNADDLKLLALRVSNLEQSVWLWKGIVFGFGSLISFVEILQALGIIRYKHTRLEDFNR